MRVLVFGTFDHLHPGHHYVLTEAGSRGDLHIVVARDATVKHVKGFLPAHDENERKSALENAYPDATVFLGHEHDYMQPVRKVQPDLIVLGYDQELPFGITENSLGCSIERLEAYEPHKYKSSILRKETK
jgi:FAD synthetase